MPQTWKENQEGLNEGYYSHCSFSSPTQAVPAEVNPRNVLNRLFAKQELNKQEHAARKPGDAARESTPLNELDRSLLDIVLGGARDLIAQRDHLHAMELVAKVLVLEPGNAEARKLAEQCESVLNSQYEAKLGTLEQRPRVLLKPDEIRWLDLDPRAGFILAQIDGGLSYEDLYDVCGLPRLDTVRILAQLVAEKVIGQAGS